jgi:hypothetical protein
MMRRDLFIWAFSLFLLSACSVFLHGQLEFPGRPLGINDRLKAAQVMYVLAPPDPLEIEAQLELNRNSNSKPFRFALERPVNLSPETHGSWSRVGDTRVWHVHVLSPGAYSLGLVFGSYALEPGVKVFVFDPAEKMVKGAFTSENNKESGVMPVGHIPGEELLIEMQVPAALSSFGELELESVSHAFLRSGYTPAGAQDCPAGEFGCSQPCEIDVNCTEGDYWSLVKRSVVRIYTTTLYCTGVLVNNTAYDGTPYILTAEHCLNSQHYADRSVFLFNYESPECFGDDGPLNLSLEGAWVRTHGDSLDFSLLELVHSPPLSYDVYYAGWDRSDFQTGGTATIHHPYGDVKKVSIDEQIPDIPAQPGDVPYSGLEDYHYYSYWWIRQWDVGSTEAGSSGGPLFNQARKVIGTLSGGQAACGDSIGYDSETERVIYNLAPNYDDYYAQFGLAWDYEEAKGNALKPWLDPVNSNAAYLDGYNPTSAEGHRISSGSRYHVFPNPAKDLFHITPRESTGEPGFYRILNLSGAIVDQGLLDAEGRAELSVSRLVPGLYLVQVGTLQYQEHHKLLVAGQ